MPRRPARDPKDPPLFNKYKNNTLNHHGGTIKLPTEAAREFDYETSWSSCSRECRNVSEADCLDYVAGYSTGNDFSARDLQTLTSSS